MDPRGIGSWELLPLKETEEAIWALDVLEAGKEGRGGRPPPKDDGTPHEVLADQVTRLRQLISLLESTLGGDSILLIFPDGTGPAVLSCLFAGIPLDRVHELNFAPGEVRLDVNYYSTQAYLSTLEQNENVQLSYKEKIARGKEQLELLRSNPNIMNERDAAYEENVRIAKEQEAGASKKREEERLERIAAKEKEEEEYRKQVEERRTQIMLEKKLERERAIQQRKEKEENGGGGVSATEIVGGVGAAGAAFAFAALSGNGDDNDNKIVDKKAILNVDEKERDAVLGLSSQASSNVTATSIDEKINTTVAISSASNIAAIDDNTSVENTAAITSDTNDLISSPGIQRMEELIVKAPIQIPEMVTEEEEASLREKRAKDAMQEYLDSDDGGEAWLDFIADLALEVDATLEEEAENEIDDLVVNSMKQNGTNQY
uniref:Uncharacterized protein n=1 Tax=Ditylum brightwellii TaxID=49249 RepID=A0A7S4T3J4_9STRA